MTAETPFLEAIKADPHDTATHRSTPTGSKNAATHGPS